MTINLRMLSKHLWPAVGLLFGILLLGASNSTNAQEAPPTPQPTATPAATPIPPPPMATPTPTLLQQTPPAIPAGPSYFDYKGVQIGMTAEEARQKLGEPKQKGKKQDFFTFSDTETAQIFYDQNQKVLAISTNYVGKQSGAPTPEAILGTEIQAKPDGSVYKLVRYPQAGYWVSYNRTAGDAPIVSVTMRKLRVTK